MKNLMIIGTILAMGIIGLVSAEPATLGVASSVVANTATSLNYNLMLGPTLVITVDQNANVTLSSFTTVTAALPAGYQTLSFGAQIGFTFAISPSSARIVSATLTTPALSANSIAIITGSVSAGCLQFDGTSYNQVDATLNSTSYQYSLPLPAVGTYVFVGVNQNATIPSFYGYARSLVAGVRQTINYTGNFLLQVSVSANSKLTVNQSSTSSFSDPTNQTNIGTYWSIELDTSATVNANFSYVYDQAIVTSKQIVEDTLRFAYYTAGQWTFDGTSSIDVSTNTVVQHTNHFSQWGVFGEKQSSSSSDSTTTTTTSGATSTTGSTTGTTATTAAATMLVLVALGFF